MSGVKSLHAALKAAKEKSALREFEVTITETLQMTVTVQAADRAAAEDIVSDKWSDSEYILDADHFVGVEFKAKKPEREHTRSGKGKEELAL